MIRLVLDLGRSEYMFPDGKCIPVAHVDVVNPPDGPNVTVPYGARLDDIVLELVAKLNDKKRGPPSYFQAYECGHTSYVIYFLYLKREPSVVADEEKLRDQQAYYRRIAG